MQTTYYCGTEDGEHFTEFSEQEHIFDALVDYYDAINDGDEGYLEGIELGIYTIGDDGLYDDMETLEFHYFKDKE
jgi:hypothetical protein